MTGFVIELGSEQTVQGGGKEWISGGFYNLYETGKGPIIVSNPTDAYVFGTKEMAERVLGADDRLKGGRVIKVT